MKDMIDISKASQMLGVDTKTLRRWDNEGKLKAYRTLGGHRRYKLLDIEKLLGIENQNTERNVFIYCRVSTKKQQQSGNLERQKQRLINYCNKRQYNVVYIFEEVASSLNDRRRQLIKMFRRLNEVYTIIVEYPDRLARFGYNYLKEFAKSLNVSIEAVEQNKKLEPNE
ncbi:chromosome-anchoring protein RacA [Clostridium tepidiprofundi DSM 19306]|uniref:Chromosome-anchoring protein RacA n=1 Tax=Clostridium tepidiprofundi DSM 19306 TaxID=1121338 RepID=A0A151AQ49_9CLOT|nr:IS607 family transposase [Clostridium tepidiprofundi]KYH29712.1 chromosome-anchoring protein RacA [Clostridium tepidiprofundi DSM 19306]